MAAGALALVAEEKARLDACRDSALRLGQMIRGTTPMASPGTRAEGVHARHGRGASEDPADADAAAEDAFAGDAAAEREFHAGTGDDAMFVLDRGRQTARRAVDALDVRFDDHGGDAGGNVKSPMHGKLVALFVADGEMVEKGQRVAIVEAMKMEHPVLAPRAGMVEGIAFEAGSAAGRRVRIMVITERRDVRR